MTPDAPLTFLDHHLACGDALLGLIDFAVLREGIAGAAYDAVVDDGAQVAKRLAKKNRDGLDEIAGTRKSGQLGLSFLDVDVARQMKELDVLSDDTLEAVATKRAALQKILTEAQDPKAHPLALAADLLVAAFLAPKTDQNEGLVPTTGDIVAVLTRRSSLWRKDRVRANGYAQCKGPPLEAPLRSGVRQRRIRRRTGQSALGHSEP